MNFFLFCWFVPIDKFQFLPFFIWWIHDIYINDVTSLEIVKCSTNRSSEEYSEDYCVISDWCRCNFIMLKNIQDKNPVQNQSKNQDWQHNGSRMRTTQDQQRHCMHCYATIASFWCGSKLKQHKYTPTTYQCATMTLLGLICWWYKRITNFDQKTNFD